MTQNVRNGRKTAIWSVANFGDQSLCICRAASEGCLLMIGIYVAPAYTTYMVEQYTVNIYRILIGIV